MRAIVRLCRPFGTVPPPRQIIVGTVLFFPQQFIGEGIQLSLSFSNFGGSCCM
jgi:hypothetical protein